MALDRMSPASPCGRVARGIALACLTMLAAAAPEAGHAAAPRVADQEILQPGTACSITGHRVRGPNGEDYGHVVNILIGSDARPTAALVRLNGFLGIGEVIVSIPWSHLHFTPAEGLDAPVTVDLTPDELHRLPPFHLGMQATAAGPPC